MTTFEEIKAQCSLAKLGTTSDEIQELENLVMLALIAHREHGRITLEQHKELAAYTVSLCWERDAELKV